MVSKTFEFKPVATPDGRFSGYGAVFGNVDSHRDVIESGAFTASIAAWRARGRWPSMKLQHGTGGNMFSGDDLPVGRWVDMFEDRNGLFVRGELLALDTDLGRRLLGLMRGGVLDSLSIGFVAKRTRAGAGRVGRYLVECDLHEISLVDTPSNDLARVLPISPMEDAADKLRDAIASLKGKDDPASDPMSKLRDALSRL